MNSIPKEKTLDNSVKLLMEGFPFIFNRVERFQSNIFETRLMGEQVFCLHGPEAARIFYDNSKFKREGAIPKRVQRTLLGENGVQTLDDASHRHRKAMFMSVMTPESIDRLLKHVYRYWKAYQRKWESMGQVVLFEDSQEVLCLAACAWANVPLKPTEVRRRARDFAAMVDAFGAVGPRHWRGRKARSRAEKWIQRIIRQARNGDIEVKEATPLHRVAWHRNLDGELLNVQIAAVELINLLRPIVAIAWYISFSAVALHRYPETRARLESDDKEYLHWFVHEVRRFYPFAPFLGARAKTDLEWNGQQIAANTLVLLDVYGALHDPEIWEDPENFRPERFQHWQGSPYDLIPQGGGDFDNGHRCAGEWITIEVTKLAVSLLVQDMDYTIPEQDLTINLRRMPTYPKSGVKIEDIENYHFNHAGYQPQQCPFHSNS